MIGIPSKCVDYSAIVMMMISMVERLEQYPAIQIIKFKISIIYLRMSIANSMDLSEHKEHSIGSQKLHKNPYRIFINAVGDSSTGEEALDLKRHYADLYLVSANPPLKPPERSVRFVNKSLKAEMIIKEEEQPKKVLILYTSGSCGANLNLQVVRGLLKKKIMENQYLYDYNAQESIEERDFLVTPPQQNGTRILYQIHQFEIIPHSINMDLQMIKQIAVAIYDNYNSYDAFIVMCGVDAICTISTFISFMFENLSKLVIFTGGYFPITFMRNDVSDSLVQAFAVISTAENLHQVVIISRNKGYRANRSIKVKEGDLGSVATPNLEPLVSINIKLNFREHLFMPAPTQPFRIWTDLCAKIGVIKFHLLLSQEALAYEINNPAYEGFVIQSYASNNLPDNIRILNLFKQVAEDKGTIFVTAAQSVHKVNFSTKKDYLEQFHIYFGGDITTEAACAKLSYLLSKKYSKSQIKKLIATNMRGEITELKNEFQFAYQDQSFMEIVNQSIEQFYPSKKLSRFLNQVQDEISKFMVGNTNYKQFEQIFKKSRVQQHDDQNFVNTVVCLIQRNHLLHKAVQAKNELLYRYFLRFHVNVNLLDQNQCSPLYYAVLIRDKKAILYFLKKEAFVICPLDELFDMFVQALLKDEWEFFELLYHIEFKDTLPNQVNTQGRTALHLAAVLGAEKSMNYLLEKFKFNLKQKDEYGRQYTDYLRSL